MKLLKSLIGVCGVALGVILIGYIIRVGFVAVLTAPIYFSFLWAVLSVIVVCFIGGFIIDKSVRLLAKTLFPKKDEQQNEA